MGPGQHDVRCHRAERDRLNPRRSIGAPSAATECRGSLLNGRLTPFNAANSGSPAPDRQPTPYRHPQPWRLPEPAFGTGRQFGLFCMAIWSTCLRHPVPTQRISLRIVDDPKHVSQRRNLAWLQHFRRKFNGLRVAHRERNELLTPRPVLDPFRRSRIRSSSTTRHFVESC